MIPILQGDNKDTGMLTIVIQPENAGTKVQTHVHLTQVSFASSYPSIDPTIAIPTHPPDTSHWLPSTVAVSDWFCFGFPRARLSLCRSIAPPRLASGFRLDPLPGSEQPEEGSPLYTQTIAQDTGWPSESLPN